MVAPAVARVGESKTETPCSVFSRDIVISRELSSITPQILLASGVVSLPVGLITGVLIPLALRAVCACYSTQNEQKYGDADRLKLALDGPSLQNWRPRIPARMFVTPLDDRVHLAQECGGQQEYALFTMILSEYVCLAFASGKVMWTMT